MAPEINYAPERQPVTEPIPGQTLAELSKKLNIKGRMTVEEFINKPDVKSKENPFPDYGKIRKIFSTITSEDVRDIAILRMEKQKKEIMTKAQQQVADLKTIVSSTVVSPSLAPARKPVAIITVAPVITAQPTVPTGAPTAQPSSTAKQPESTPKTPQINQKQLSNELQRQTEGFYQMEHNQNVYMYVFDTQDKQNLTFQRITAFVEDINNHGTIIKTPEKTIGYGAHDISSAGFTAFFNKVGDNVTPQEHDLRTKLIAMKFIENNTSGGYIELKPAKSMLTVPKTGLKEKQLQASQSHEFSHGEYFTVPEYKTVMKKFYDNLGADQKLVQDALSVSGYNPKDDDLMANELQAYLLFTDPADNILIKSTKVPSPKGNEKRLAPEKFNTLKTDLVTMVKNANLKINPALKRNDSMAVVPAVATTKPQLTVTAAPKSPESLAIKGNPYDIGVQVFEKLRKPGESISFSPTSLQQVLYIYTLSHSNTDLAKTLGFDGPEKAKFETLLKTLNAPDAAPFKSVNAIFSKLGAFGNKTLMEDLKVQLGTIDPKNIPGETARLNKFVSDQTKGMITNLFKESDVRSAQEIFLNTMYFKGNWASKFDSTKTEKDQKFGTGKKADLMNQTGSYETLKTKTAQVVKMPFEGDSSMIAFLPNDDLATTIAEANTLLKNPTKIPFESKKKTALTFPKFDTESTANGIEGMLNIDTKIIQKSKVSVTEEGAKAAAATTGATRGVMHVEEIYELKFNKPFYYAIQDKDGNVHFMGTYEGR